MDTWQMGQMSMKALCQSLHHALKLQELVRANPRALLVTERRARLALVPIAAMLQGCERSGVPCGRASAPRARWARTLSERTAAKPRASLRSSPRTRCSHGLQTASPSDLDPLSARPCQAAGMKPLDRSSAARRHVVVLWRFAPENCRLRRGVLPVRIESRQSRGGKIRAT